MACECNDCTQGRFDILLEAVLMLTVIDRTPDGAIVIGPMGWQKLQEALEEVAD